MARVSEAMTSQAVEVFALHGFLGGKADWQFVFEFIRQENEGHGFHKEEARVGFYKQLDQFLDKYLQHANNARVLIKDTKVVEMPARP